MSLTETKRHNVNKKPCSCHCYQAKGGMGTITIPPIKCRLQQERGPYNLTVVLDKLFRTIPGEDFIDSNDFIIQINKATTKGYERDVATRSTHHVMYPESARDLNGNTNLLLVPFKILDLQWIISALSTGNTYMAVNFFLLKSLFFRGTSMMEGHRRYPSTGFLSLIFALHICSEVNVFGADQNGNWHHYWKTRVHDANQEHIIIQMLADAYRCFPWS
uniref:ST3 beta-galactoside alpha-2,3-sialyltransferase 1 n=1 Tax=Electrophorus electricus TaxID=8005 RepID=A0A4W4H828_ELEEL